MSRLTAHPARVLRRLAAAGLGQREAGEQVVRDLAGVLQVAELCHQHEVLASAEDLVDGGELPREADRLPHVLRLRRHVEAVHAGGAGILLEQGGEDAS